MTVDLETVIDLTAAVPARRRRRPTPFHALTEAQRRRLLVRVLCELVAYGELDVRRDLAHRPPPRRGIGTGSYAPSARSRSLSASH